MGGHTFGNLEFEDDQIVGSYRFVISAKETAEDGELNRDRQPKPALQKGTTMTQWLIFLVSCQSMRTSQYHSLQQEFLSKGVGAVAGFHGLISSRKAWEYSDAFYAYAHDGVGGLGYPLSIAAAHALAIDDVASMWGDTFGLESFD